MFDRGVVVLIRLSIVMTNHVHVNIIDDMHMMITCHVYMITQHT